MVAGKQAADKIKTSEAARNLSSQVGCVVHNHVSLLPPPSASFCCSFFLSFFFFFFFFFFGSRLFPIGSVCRHPSTLARPASLGRASCGTSKRQVAALPRCFPRNARGCLCISTCQPHTCIVGLVAAQLQNYKKLEEEGRKLEEAERRRK